MTQTFMSPRHRPAPPPAGSVVTTPALARRRIYLHQSVIDWMGDPSSDRQLTQRAKLVLWQMFAQGSPTQVKSVRGAGRGWLRSDLGGNNGHQFYLWWTRGGAPPLKGRGMSHGDVLVRAIRHHDETDRALDPGEREAWLPLEATELDAFKLSPALLPTQDAVLSAAGTARIVRGHPGTGKTTVLGRAALARPEAKVLYLTYSDGLATRAKEHVREFARDGTDVRVGTFRELFRELRDAWLEAPRAADAQGGEVAALQRALAAYQERYAPWDRHPGALHAELHACFVGAALPEAFRGAPACAFPGFDAEAYVALRRDAIGERAAAAAARVGAFLHARDVLREVAPGPWEAFHLLARLRAGAAIPARYADVDAVIVDEVQDLTRVEAMLLLDVVDAIRRAGGREVELLVAGDEGQTVRPTDFDWGVFSDIVTRRFPDPRTFDLVGNVRSPRALAAVLHRTTDLYRDLAKDQRPRGRATDDIEESVSGRVVRCVVRDEAELLRVAETIASLPRAALVHPGDALPEGLALGDREALSSATAKGLDYAVVAVLGAGRHIAAARALAEQGGSDPLHAALARTMIDQLRVAVSRASDTLILVDREGDEGARELDRLVRAEDGERIEGFLGELGVDDVVALLDRSDATSEELVREFLVDVQAALSERPRFALERARRARGLLGRADSKVGVMDRGLREEVMRLQGVAALLVALAPDTSASDASALFTEANRSLHAGGQGDAARAALWIRDLRALGAGAAGAARSLVRALPRLDADVAAWGTVLRAELTRWSERCASADLPAGARAVIEVVEVVESVAAALEARGERLDGATARVRERALELLLQAGQATEALSIALRMVPASGHAEGRCHEALGRHREAAECFLQAGALRDALRCVRAEGDIERALELATQLDATDREALARLRALRDALAATEAHRDGYTERELAGIRAAWERAFPARRGSRAVLTKTPADKG